MQLHPGRPNSLFRLGLSLVVVTGSAATALASDNAPAVPSAPAIRPGIRTYIPVDLPDTENAAAGGDFSRILFLNKCAGGCTIYYGNDNSSTNTSGISGGTRNLSAYDGGKWAEIVACVKRIFSPFDVEVTDVDPGGTPHMEAIVAGTANQLGMGSNILGVAPFVCGYIPRSMSYTFANAFDSFYPAGAIPREVCATIGQEVAHTWGFDHEMLASDPMTYLEYNGERAFQDQASRCGEDVNRDCNCGGSTQNSYQKILSIFGAADPTPPIVTITNLDFGDQVEPGFAVRAEVDDENGVDHVELWIDGAMTSSLAFPPYALNAPDDLADGTHQVKIIAYDLQDTPGEDSVDVIIGEPCATPGDCVDAGENYTCMGGRCVPGEGAVGGLGTSCESGVDCFSGICLSSNSGSLCGEVCERGGGQCPDGYGCLELSDGTGSCWPGVDEGGGEGDCSSAGGGSAAPIALSLGLVGFVLSRRRRPAAR